MAINFKTRKRYTGYFFKMKYLLTFSINQKVKERIDMKDRREEYQNQFVLIDLFT